MGSGKKFLEEHEILHIASIFEKYSLLGSTICKIVKIMKVKEWKTKKTWKVSKKHDPGVSFAMKGTGKLVRSEYGINADLFSFIILL